RHALGPVARGAHHDRGRRAHAGHSLVRPAGPCRHARCRGRAHPAVGPARHADGRSAPALCRPGRRARWRDTGRVRRLHRPGTQELGPDRQGRRPVAGIVLPSRPSPPPMQEDIAALLRQPFGSLPELVALQASQRPRHTALAMDGRSLDYAALRLGMDRVALRLQRQGLGSGD
ncbi:conserved hypothetical protein, partial [Ricinus communis]